MWLAGGVEVSFHRIGAAAWSGHDVLRSWADAPWRTAPDGVVVACRPDEALWLGLGVESGGAPPTPGTAPTIGPTVALTDMASGEAACCTLPAGWQLGALASPNGAIRPIDLGTAPARRFRFEVVRAPGAPVSSFALRLVSPSAWPAEWGPLELPPAEQPLPVPAYTQLVRPGRPRPSNP